MALVTVVIPNYNGLKYIEDCLSSLEAQSFKDFDICLVDNHSTDGSLELVEKSFQKVRIIKNEVNYGFARAVNQGIRDSSSEYVILLNNDTVCHRDFVEGLYRAIRADKKVFAYQARMIKLYDREHLDSAGDLYCALGWAFALGKDADLKKYTKDCEVFSACGGAAIYRRALFEEIGYFDEGHESYLEDVDICYRAKINGYRNRYTPEAIVYHAGSGVSGSRHNAFKVRLSSRNSVYLIYKNMPFLQLLINLPFLLAGYIVKYFYFLKKGLGAEYAKGVLKGFGLCKKGKKYSFRGKNIFNYFRIQVELWVNLIRRVTG
ncbi:MAG: glycosyltransferase family 2 protein [Lachnospiraceae bacterium]|nr:glycosyltransferase family 2 protein [Lachnospiraceae bacterium]